MGPVRYDLHTHTAFSDGWDWREMAAAAAAIGLDGIGFTDHCPVVADPFGRRERYDFPDTYAERRAEFREDARAFDVRIFDGAEVNYDPTAEAEIRSFLETAGFEYTIGSVHTIPDAHVPNPDASLAEAAPETKAAMIDRYVDRQVALVESELFDIIGHIDLPQRTDTLADLMEPSHHERLATALADHRTIPEINAGRLNRSLGTVHPDPGVLDIYAAHDVEFVLGTDSHAPDQLTERIALLGEMLPELPVTIRPLPAILSQPDTAAAGRGQLD